MPRQSVRHHGNRTSPAQQRINRALSEAALSRLLQMNFSGGARVIVLAYEPGGYVPVGAYAEPDITGWVRRSREQLGGVFRYVRVTARAGEGAATVHRVVVPCQCTEAAALAARWEHGPAWTEAVEPGQLAALAEQLLANAQSGVCRHSWKASKGLIRS